MPQSRQYASHTPAYLQLDPPRWWEFTNCLVSSSQPAPGGGREISANGFNPIVAEYTEAQLDSACSTAEILCHAIDESYDFESSSKIFTRAVDYLESSFDLPTPYFPSFATVRDITHLGHQRSDMQRFTCGTVHVVQTTHPQTLIRPNLRKEEPLRTSSALFFPLIVLTLWASPSPGFERSHLFARCDR
ncbi:hypothetical protein BDP55DRAFT_628051 [Colletotrichum godetiae]|uniref:Uncharacterized protein n=1 Tax=Colletotrichum godetiae TaxID=1209918 RepID=A0AAJ0EWX1_9PEZI|nr:uncharacterized protein BDP55DRAFT_628051 [Colletotrichum godetiae]KAK1690369.1 hypothetical protein BDP55DRAFT_628051 [Colletotrichum godetiae]